MKDKSVISKDKNDYSNHSVYRYIIFNRFIAGIEPLINGIDILNKSGDVEKGRGIAVGERDGNYVNYKLLYTNRNLEIVKTVLTDKSTIIVEPDNGLILQG